MRRRLTVLTRSAAHSRTENRKSSLKHRNAPVLHKISKRLKENKEPPSTSFILRRKRKRIPSSISKGCDYPYETNFDSTFER